MKVLNDHLNGKYFLVGDSLTIADIVVAGFLTMFFQTLFDAGYRKAVPHVTNWFERCMGLPSFIRRLGRVEMAQKALKPFGAKAEPIKEIVKSKSDKRNYKCIVLDNKLRCILINDPEGDKSAAAINVKVGFTLDPKEVPGVAHFLEHMLFQGTKKYPDITEYSKYISDNGGYDNAFTGQTYTNFHFDCSNEAFEGALDRLAQFFICPTFSEAATEKEANAVDSEWNMSMQSDYWHFINLWLMLSNPASMACKFDCGNLESLKGEGVR